MMTPRPDEYLNPEPVPEVSQLAVLPFLSAVERVLTVETDDKKFRITMHRTMVRENLTYLQQLCIYLGPTKADQSRVGRIFDTNEGIIGHAFEHKQIVRTRRYERLDDLKNHLREDMARTGDKRPLKEVPIAYLAIPFLGQNNQVVMVLYADTFEFNFFAKDDRIRHIKLMCDGFSRLFDYLQEHQFAKLRNFPLQAGQPSRGKPTVYPQLQERIDWLEVPKFEKVSSFNYEALA
jgi:hypothetical protein